MNSVQTIMAAVEAGTPIDARLYSDFTGGNGLQNFAVAAASFVAGDVVSANKWIAAALAENTTFTRSSWFLEHVAAHMPPKAFCDPELHPWFPLQKLFLERQHGPVSTALTLASQGLSSKIEDADCHYRLFEEGCEALMRDGSLADPSKEMALETFIAAHRHQSAIGATLYDGCLAHHRKSYEKAAAQFESFAKSEATFSHFARGAQSYRANIFDAPLPRPTVFFERKARGRTVVFTCDPKYFAAWNPLILNALHEAPQDCGVHFHLIGEPNETALNSTMAENPRIGLSWEADPGLGSPYYASARFISGGSILSHYDRPLLFADIDCTFSPDLSEFFEFLGDKPSGFFLKGTDCHFPWRSITASLFYLPPTTAAEDFLSRTQTYLLGLFGEPAEERNLWWCDQNALSYAYHRSELGNGAQSLFDLKGYGKPLPFTFAPNHSARKAEFIARHSR